jgi:ABC-type sugar transport system ATPase subunit
MILDPYGRLPEAVDAANGRLLRSLYADNPQKAPIARCLRADCGTLLFDNPTRGLSVSSRLQVHQAIHDIAGLGVAIVAASTNPEELMTFCDRIAVMVNGRIVKTFDRPSFNPDKLRAAMKSRK